MGVWAMLFRSGSCGFFTTGTIFGGIGTARGAVALATLQHAASAMGGWGALKGTQPRHMASCGPLGGCF